MCANPAHFFTGRRGFRKYEFVRRDVDFPEVRPRSKQRLEVDQRETEVPLVAMSTTDARIPMNGEMPIAADEAAQVSSLVVDRLLRERRELADAQKGVAGSQVGP